MDFNVIFEKNARRFSDKPILHFSDTGLSLSHVQIRDFSLRLSRWMLDQGIGKGDRVGLWMGNVCEYALIVAACLRIGASAVPFSIYESCENIERMCTEGKCRLLLLDGGNKHIGRRIKQSPLHLSHIQTIDVSASNMTDGIRLGFIPADLPVHPIHCARRNDEEAFLLFTSGSTGEKKPVSKPLSSLTFSHFLRAALRMIGFLYPLRWFSMFPWCHISGIILLFGILDGTWAFCCTTDHFNPRSTLKALAEYQITVWNGTATMLSRCCTCNHDTQFRLPPILLASGESVSRHVLSILERQTGASVMISSYGSTEIGGAARMCYLFSSPALFIRVLLHIFKRSLSIHQVYSFKDFDTDQRALPLGDILPRLQIAIYDEETNRLLPDGVPGEILAHSSRLTSQYADARPEKLCFELGGKLYVRTGDLGYTHGRKLYLIGRKKNLIIRSGENIIPAEIEQAAVLQPGVQAAAACSVPSMDYGEDICLCLESDGNPIDLPALTQRLDQMLPRYMMPKYIEVLDEFPLNSTGKTDLLKLRSTMAQKYGAQQVSRYPLYNPPVTSPAAPND